MLPGSTLLLRACCLAVAPAAAQPRPLLYYAERPLRRPRAAPTPSCVVAVCRARSVSPSLIINFTGDVRTRQLANNRASTTF